MGWKEIFGLSDEEKRSGEVFYGNQNNRQIQSQPQNSKKESMVPKSDEGKREERKESPLVGCGGQAPKQPTAKDWELNPWPQGYSGPAPRRPTFSAPLRPKKDLIVIVVENSDETQMYQREILRIVNKIVEDNKEQFFMFLRVGKNKKNFDIVDYDCYIKNNILESLFYSSNQDECIIDYTEALRYIDRYYLATIYKFQYNEKVYERQYLRLIFIGSGKVSCSESETSNLLQKLSSTDKIKTIKYFCMKDTQTVDVAKLGFPVIGHIVTDYYK